MKIPPLSLKLIVQTLVVSFALAVTSSLPNCRVSAQGQRFNIGDTVEVDTFMAGTYPGSEKYATWRKGVIVRFDQPENRFGAYVVKLDQDGTEFRVRFVDRQWIRVPQGQAGTFDSTGETFAGIPVTARSIELFKPSLGDFKLLNTSLNVQLPTPFAGISIIEQARDSAEGLYRLPSGQNIKLVALNYPSTDVSFAMLDRIELEMRRQSFVVTPLKRKDNRAFQVEIGSGKSFVAWTNGFRAFLTFGVGSDTPLFFKAGIY